MKVVGLWVGPYLAFVIAYDRIANSSEADRLLLGSETNLFVKLVSGLVKPVQLITLVLLVIVCWAEIRFRGPRSWLIPLIFLPIALCWNLLLIARRGWAELASLDVLQMIAFGAGVKILIGVGLFFGIAWIYRQKPLKTAVDSDRS